MSDSDDPIREVLIVGAGPAGIVAAKTLLENGISNIVVLEETQTVGGLWNCIPQAQEHRPQVPCYITLPPPSSSLADNSQETVQLPIPASNQPVYKELKANFPKDLSSFLDLAFDSHLEMFPKPPVVAKYYQEYCQQFGVDRVVQLQTRVVNCIKKDGVWHVETMNTRKKQEDRGGENPTTKTMHKAKRLLICNGHFRKAYCPYIPGLELYHFNKSKPRLQILHSSAFDYTPDMYKNQTVLIIGGNISGSDIAKILLEKGTCRRVVVSARNIKLFQTILLPPLVREYGLIVRPGIETMDANGQFYFFDNDNPKIAKYYTPNLPPTEQPDIVIFGTGYRYDFPFLSMPPSVSDNEKKNEGPSSNGSFVRSDGYRMEHLYKRILYVNDCSLAFLGVTNQNISPAIVFEYQAKWYTQMVVIDDGQKLPSRNVMLQEAEHRRQADPTQDALGPKFPSYCNSLARDINVRGYWMQILCNRMPLLLKTWWTRRRVTPSNNDKDEGRSDSNSNPFTKHIVIVVGSAMALGAMTVALGCGFGFSSLSTTNRK